jgi:hypothetical protein
MARQALPNDFVLYDNEEANHLPNDADMSQQFVGTSSNMHYYQQSMQYQSVQYRYQQPNISNTRYRNPLSPDLWLNVPPASLTPPQGKKSLLAP